MNFWNWKTGMIIALILCITAAIILAGCTSIQGTAKSATVAPGAVSYGGGESESYNRADSSHGAYAPLPVPTVVPTTSGQFEQGTDTKIIRTADITLEVKNIGEAAASVETICTGSNGYVSTTNIGTDYAGEPYGTVVIRVPAANFTPTLSGLQGLGTTKSISTQGQDVTGEYVDVQAQITAYQNQIAQYNQIMKNATSVEDVLAVQQQIDQVQTDLDRVNGRMKYLNNQVDYSTISVTLQEPAPVGGTQSHDFMSAINEGIAGFFGVIDAIIVLVISVLPLVIIGCVAYGGYHYWKGRTQGQP